MSFKWLFVPVLFMLVACGPDASSGSSIGNSQEPEDPQEPDTTEKPAVPRDLSEKDFTLQMDRDSIKALLGNDHFKLVFRNDDEEYLIVLDYTGDSVKMTKMADGYNAYHPTFSPDGKKVAFCTAYEGAPFGSSLYVINLDNPKKVDSLKVENAAIPRWLVMPDGDTVITFIDFNGDNQKVEWFTSATWQVSYEGNKFGTPKKLFGRSYNGGFAYDLSFAATGASRLYFHWAEDEDDVVDERYNWQQVCNVSVSRDSSKLVSFLETAGELGREFTQDTSGVWHRYVFYEDETGKIVKAIISPEMTVFDHVEWLRDIPVQVGILSSMNLEYYDVVLIDYAESNVQFLVRSDSVSMWHPDLWIAQ